MRHPSFSCVSSFSNNLQLARAVQRLAIAIDAKLLRHVTAEIIERVTFEQIECCIHQSQASVAAE